MKVERTAFIRIREGGKAMNPRGEVVKLPNLDGVRLHVDSFRIAGLRGGLNPEGVLTVKV